MADWLNALWINQGFSKMQWHIAGRVKEMLWPRSGENISTHKPKRSIQPFRKSEKWPLKHELELYKKPILGETAHGEGKGAKNGSGFSTVRSFNIVFPESLMQTCDSGGNYGAVFSGNNETKTNSEHQGVWILPIGARKEHTVIWTKGQGFEQSGLRDFPKNQQR